MKFYHNARCSKSREALSLLQEKGHSPEIIEYMKEPLTPGELEDLLAKLKMPAEDLVRKSEKVWKEEYADKELMGDEIVLAMIEHPQLMQRPILEKDDRAAVGRPPEKLLKIL